MKSPAFQQTWLDYRKACYGDAPLPESQERETRQAFFSGALVAFATVSEISALPEQVAVAVMDGFYKELMEGCAEISKANFRKNN